MRCVKCGRELLATKCERCNYEHKDLSVTLLTTPEAGELDLSWKSMRLEQLQEKIAQKEQELRQMQEVLMRRLEEQRAAQLEKRRQEAAEGPATAAQWVPTGRRPRKPRRSVAGFEQYLKLLEEYFLRQFQKGEPLKPLTRNQVLQFINLYSLDKDHGITSLDVEKDLQGVYRKHRVVDADGADAPALPEYIKCFRDYDSVLSALYIQNDKRILSEEQIRQFLADYQLTERFGIREWDVKVDLGRIARELP